MALNLVTVCGNKNPALAQMLDHYKGLVDNIYINIHGGVSPESLEEVKKVARTLGCGIYKVHEGAYANWSQVTQIYNETLRTRPNDWWIIADSDELQVYPRPIKEIIAQCERKDYRYVTGAFLDRIGPKGTFPEITPESDLWKLFPNAGFFRYPISGACPNKVTLAKGSTRLHDGQHYASVKAADFPRLSTYLKALTYQWRYPVNECFVQVHHFKWDMTVIARTRLVTETRRDYSYYWEYELMLKFIEQHHNLIPFKETFLIQECGSRFDDFRNWEAVREQCLPMDDTLPRSPLNLSNRLIKEYCHWLNMHSRKRARSFIWSLSRQFFPPVTQK